eukprot:7372848-Ditylum_brightwellii.AAC.1
MKWNNNTLVFYVYHKGNQQLKYLNKESCHRTTTVKAIPVGVFIPLGRLTFITPHNCNSPTTDLCAEHKKALKQANLLPKKIPTLGELYPTEQNMKLKWRGRTINGNFSLLLDMQDFGKQTSP